MKTVEISPEEFRTLQDYKHESPHKLAKGKTEAILLLSRNVDLEVVTELAERTTTTIKTRLRDWHQDPTRIDTHRPRRQPQRIQTHPPAAHRNHDGAATTTRCPRTPHRALDHTRPRQLARLPLPHGLRLRDLQPLPAPIWPGCPSTHPGPSTNTEPPKPRSQPA